MDNTLCVGQEIIYLLDGQLRIGILEKIAINEKTAVVLTRQDERVIYPIEELIPLKKIARRTKCKQ